MDFQSVYECLLDVFPQVDARLLKAVAIEHYKDADVAVETVLSEIIPHLSKSKLYEAPSISHKERQNGVASRAMQKDKSPIVDVTYSAGNNMNPTDASTYTQMNKWPTFASTPEKHSPRELFNEGDDEEQRNLLRPKQRVVMSKGASSSVAKAAYDDNFSGLDPAYYLNASSIGNAVDENVVSSHGVGFEQDKKVELQEKAAEQTQDEAAKARLDILKKVDELKEMLTHAKEANDMHAREVYGEKSILATEVRELLARVVDLSEERDKSMGILTEMQLSLDTRRAEAMKYTLAAEKEKLEKEESMQSLLAEQEAIMEKVVQESKILQNEAEENSKLRDLLTEHGHVVDTLQGEISVICEDVRSLKEKFDNRVPLSKVFSSSQTRCILASSTSSLKSVPFDLVKYLGEGYPAESVNDQSPKSSQTPPAVGEALKKSFEDETINGVHKELLNDVWDTLSGVHKELLKDKWDTINGNRKELLNDGWVFFEDGSD